MKFKRFGPYLNRSKTSVSKVLPKC